MGRSNKLRGYHYFQDNHGYKNLLKVFTTGNVKHPWHPSRFSYHASDISLYFPMPYDCEEHIYGLSNIWEAREFLTNERNAKRSEELLTALLKHDRTVFNNIIPPTQRVNLAISLLYLGHIVSNPLYEAVLKKFYGGRKNATTLALYSLVLRDLHDKLEDGSAPMKATDATYFRDEIHGTITDSKGVGALLDSVPDQEELARKFMYLNEVAYNRYFSILRDLYYETSYSDVEIYRAQWIEFAKWLVGEIYSRISRQESVAKTLVPALADHIILSSGMTNMIKRNREGFLGYGCSEMQYEPIMSVFCTQWFRDTLRRHMFPHDAVDDNMTTRLRHSEMIKKLSYSQRESRLLDNVSSLIESPQVQSLLAELNAEEEE